MIFPPILNMTVYEITVFYDRILGKYMTYCDIEHPGYDRDIQLVKIFETEICPTDLKVVILRDEEDPDDISIELVRVDYFPGRSMGILLYEHYFQEVRTYSYARRTRFISLLQSAPPREKGFKIEAVFYVTNLEQIKIVALKIVTFSHDGYCSDEENVESSKTYVDHFPSDLSDTSIVSLNNTQHISCGSMVCRSGYCKETGEYLQHAQRAVILDVHQFTEGGELLCRDGEEQESDSE
jgi:hypothetical protein